MLNAYQLSAISILIFIILIFIVAQIKNDNSKIDIGWGTGFIVSAFAMLFLNINLKLIFVFLILFIWGSRLSIYIYIRSKGKPEDFRYTEMRKNWGSRQKFNAFYRVFLLQAVLMYIVNLPIISAFHKGQAEFSPVNVAGLIIFVVGFLFETTADLQMYRFKKEESNKGKIIKSGLWKYSRHPNYFGEMILWWGIYLFTFQTETFWWTIISPALISFLLLKVSGVPMLEKKFEKNPEWEIYRENTPAFFPSFRKVKK